MSARVPVLHFFFFQAEDGIRDSSVTGVQTCALPICLLASLFEHARFAEPGFPDHEQSLPLPGARAFEDEGDSRQYPFPFEHRVPARILSLRGLTDDPRPGRT